jgi:hypothetical protein
MAGKLQELGKHFKWPYNRYCYYTTNLFKIRQLSANNVQSIAHEFYRFLKLIQHIFFSLPGRCNDGMFLFTTLSRPGLGLIQSPLGVLTLGAK